MVTCSSELFAHFDNVGLCLKPELSSLSASLMTFRKRPLTPPATDPPRPQRGSGHP